MTGIASEIRSGTRPYKVIVVLASLVIILAGLQASQSLVVPFLLAGFISVILLQALNWLQRKGLSRWLSMVIVMGVGLITILLLSALVGNSIDQFRDSLPEYQNKLSTDLGQLFSWLEKLGISGVENSISDAMSPTRALQYVGDMLGNLAGFVANSFLILLTVAFVLAEISILPNKIRRSIDNPDAMLAKVNAFTSSANNYVTIKAAVSALTGFLVAILLAVLGVDFPVLWGVLAFLLNFVPNIGSIFAAVPAVVLAFVQIGPGTALFAALGYVIINLVVGNLIEPRFMGKSVGLSTLVVFISLIFWGFILGPVGMLLSVPLTMMIKIGLSENSDTAWISSLLGNGTNDPN